MATINWTSLGTPGTISANPSVGKNDDGSLEAFVWTVGVDAAKDLWHIGQTTTGGTWGDWSSLGHPPTGLMLEGSPIVVQNDDGAWRFSPQDLTMRSGISGSLSPMEAGVTGTPWASQRTRVLDLFSVCM